MTMDFIRGQARITKRQRLQLMLWTYFDESGKLGDSDFICLCGYIADEAGWEGFAKDWHHVLTRHGIPFLHTSALFNGSKPYKKTDWPDDRRDAAMLDFASVALKHASGAFGIGVDTKFYKTMPKEDREVLGGKKPELFLFQRILHQVVRAVAQWPQPEEVSLNFDSEDEFSVSSLRDLIWIQNNRPEVKALVRAIAFCNDESFMPIQAADMLAYGTKRYMQGDPPPYFDALVKGVGGNEPLPPFSERYDAEGLRKTVAEIRRLGVRSISDLEALAASGRQPS
jgi:hypothetical protein